MSLALFLYCGCSRSGCFFGSFNILADRPLRTILMFDTNILLRMGLDSLIRSYNVDIQNRSLSGSSNTTTLGDELVVWGALINLA